MRISKRKKKRRARNMRMNDQELQSYNLGRPNKSHYAKQENIRGKN